MHLCPLDIYLFAKLFISHGMYSNLVCHSLVHEPRCNYAPGMKHFQISFNITKAHNPAAVKTLHILMDPIINRRNMPVISLMSIIYLIFVFMLLHVCAFSDLVNLCHLFIVLVLKKYIVCT